MRTLQRITLQNLGIAAALALGLAVAACDEDGGDGTGNEQLGAVPQEPAGMAPAAGTLPEAPPATPEENAQ